MTGAAGRVAGKPTQPEGSLEATPLQRAGNFRRLNGTGGMYRPGDRVVYTASKHSRHPGPRAERVTPERNGEGYFYDVRKYWVVRAVEPDGRLTVITRRGKERHVRADDERLRLARWWETLFFASRFPSASPSNPSDPADRGRIPAGT